MKKIILSLVGVVGMTAGSWGQSFTPNPDGSFWVNGLSASSHGTGIPNNLYGEKTNFSGKFIQSQEIKTHIVSLITSDNGFWGTDTNKPIYVLESDTNVVLVASLSSFWSFVHRVTGDATASYESAEFPWEVSLWNDEGLTAPNGLSFHNQDPNEPRGLGGVMATAQQLNTGLTFQNGQWTPTQQ